MPLVTLFSIVVLFWVPRLWPRIAGVPQKETKLRRFLLEQHDALVNGCCIKPDVGLWNVQPWDTCSAGKDKENFIPCQSLDRVHHYSREFVPHLPLFLYSKT